MEETRSKSTHLEHELLLATIEHDFARFLRSDQRPKPKDGGIPFAFCHYAACRLTGEMLTLKVTRPAHLIALRKREFRRSDKTGFAKLQARSRGYRVNFNSSDLVWLEAGVKGTFTLGDAELLWMLIYATRETTNILRKLSDKVSEINFSEVHGKEMKAQMRNLESRLNFLRKITELVEKFEETRGKERLKDIFSFFAQIDKDSRALSKMQKQEFE